MRVVRLCFAVLVGLAPSAARAYDYSSFIFFGDSLTDQGRAGQTAPVMWPAVLRTDTSITAGANYAIGGAITSNQPSAKFGDSSYLGQINSFIASGTPIQPNTAAGIWIGANNIQIGASQHVAPATIASSARADVATGIKDLVGVGVHGFLLLGVYDLSLTNAFLLAGTDTIATRSIAASASQQYNAQLAALSVPGASILYFNIANFINHLMTNPQAYGFTQILPLQPGAICNATCQRTSIFDDTIHVSAKTQALIGAYVASGDPIYNGATFTYGEIAENYASAIESAPMVAELARSAALGFVGALFDRLDLTRGLSAQPASAGGQGRSVASLANPWSVFATGSFADGTFAHVGTVTGYQNDLDYSVSGLTAGVQFDASRDLRFGAAFNYGHAESNLTATIGTTTKIDAYQGAIYGSLSYPNWFIDGIATFGADAVAQTRNGLFGPIKGNPSGDTFTASGRGGYLFKTGFVRVGPVLGISYSRTSFGAYAETGDPLNTIAYGSQLSNGVDGSAGIEARLADPTFWPVSPVLTVVYEHQFISRGQPIAASYVYLPTQTLPTSVYAGVDDVKIALGAALNLGKGWQGSLAAFGLAGLHDMYVAGVNGGLTYRF
jgi:uncharacterized protein YhjY with autotransporter beta-barrel domain